MLPSEFRLKKERNFEILFKEGQFVSGKGVDLKFWQIKTDKYPDRFQKNELKLGFVVSTDISNKATVRNRKKRQMREAIRKLLDEKDLGQGYLIALIANKEILDMDFNEISKTIESLFNQANILL